MSVAISLYIKPFCHSGHRWSTCIASRCSGATNFPYLNTEVLWTRGYHFTPDWRNLCRTKWTMFGDYDGVLPTLKYSTSCSMKHLDYNTAIKSRRKAKDFIQGADERLGFLMALKRMPNLRKCPAALLCELFALLSIFHFCLLHRIQSTSTFLFLSQIGFNIYTSNEIEGASRLFWFWD